ncbi:hypothetical protein CSIM01_09131 [Colletotrichum simmondsii]|uniref:Nephrocystin 3-like N-terminal domain-containing protein n=1 Tax=Colletotrichum simmondsii TaxID=703756 RepID=A0A135TWJ9_9PEZI|nr:hypothetical protein CSIM01_09131 [Colletotrichum simmondsii]
MADPLSIAASIAGLLSLADIVFLRLSKYIKSVKNAEKEISDLCKEVNLVGGTVNMLSRLANSLEVEDKFPIQGFRMHHVDGCAAILSEIINKTKKDALREKILDFFLEYNPQSNYEMSVKLRHPRTGMWLERHSSFQQWLSTSGSRLWLSGIPGAGKTVLAGSIISHALARSSDTVAVGFFFCDYKNETTQSPVNILGGLAYQLALQSEKAYSMLEEYYSELHPDKGLPRSPNTEDLGRTILRMLQVFEHTYIVVDGLDECGGHAEEVVEALCDIAENSDELSMALLSRDEDDIQRHLRDSEKNFLNIEIAAHTDDITEFLTSEIERRISNRKLVFEDLSLKAEVLESLVAGAHGMFRWVACQLDHLGGCDSDEQCREALRSLPPDLPETYMRILRRVSPAKQTQVQMTLHFIAYAEPKLHIERLREVLSIPSTSRHLSPSGIIREDAIARYNEYPLYEYAAQYWLCFAREEWTHPDLLAKAKRLFDPRKSTYFTSWAATLIIEITTYPIDPLMRSESDDMRSISLIAEIIHDNFRPLHLAATMSLPEISSFLLETSHHYGTKCILGTPAECAVRCLHGAFEQLHLIVGSDEESPGKPGSRFYDMLHSFQPYIGKHNSETSFTVETVRRFLDVDLQAPEDLFGASLTAGIRIRNLSVAQLLVAKGFVPNQQNLDCFQREMNITLYGGAWLWQEQNLSSLCQFCEALSSRIDDSPLHFQFCQSAWDCCLQLSLSVGDIEGYNISSKVTNDPHSLETMALVACQTNDISMLQEVVDDQRIDVSSIVSPNHEDGLLHLLVRSGYEEDRTDDTWIVEAEEVLDLLLSVGCSLSKRNSDGHTPLTLAIEERQIEFAGVILKRCENEQAAWECQTPILLLVAESGSEEILTLLRSMGLEVHPADYEQKNPLHCLNSDAALAMVKELESLIPDARQCRSSAKLPWESYMDTILAERPEAPYLGPSYSISPATEVLEYLVQPLTAHSDPSEASKVWKHYAARTLQGEHLAHKYVDETARCLTRVGIFDAYEEDHSQSALLPIAEACSNKWLATPHIKNFPLRDETLCFLLKTTKYWNSFKQSSYAVELLKVAATLKHNMTVDQLLIRGISVHRRFGTFSVLEHFCALPATQEDDTLRVRQLLDHADPMYLNHTNPTSGLGLIHISNMADVPHFRHGILKMLLECGASPDLRTNTSLQSPALVYHLSNNNIDLAAVLLRQGADPTISCRSGWTATHAAIAFGNVSFLSVLLEHRKPTWQIDWEGQSGINYGPQVYRGIRPLHLAALRSVDCLQFILEEVVSISLEAPAENGYTAVHFAVVGGKPSAIELLHARGANINARSVDGELALHIAVDSGDIVAVKRLVKLGSEMTPDCHGTTPLLLAYQHNNQEIIDCLRSYNLDQNGCSERVKMSSGHGCGSNAKLHSEQVGADSSAVLALAVNREWQGKTPLLRATCVEEVSIHIVQLLIDNGADLEAKDNWGCTPLHNLAMASAEVDHSAVIRVLLRAGGNVNCRDNNGATPMAKACSRGNSFAISALMDQSPDVLFKDHKRRNVLHYLFSSRDTDGRDSCRPALFTKLTQTGVKPSEVDMFGCSALHLSTHNKYMTALLLNGTVQIQDERPIPWSTLFMDQDAVNAACLATAFRLYRRKLSTERFRRLLNLEDIGSRNPLCFAAFRGQIQVMENILSLGIPIDFEGCPEGSALMAASSAGNLESVIYLVRHGASIAFQGHNDFRSAVKLAATSPRVVHWLLVDRFTDQKKLDQIGHESTSLSTCYKPWSGIHKAEMIISGRWERQPHESSRQYWARLSNMTEDFRGKFLPPNKGKKTRRRSKLVPSEPVKIAADGYFVPYDASAGECVTRKSKWSELSLEVRECLERYCL